MTKKIKVTAMVLALFSFVGCSEKKDTSYFENSIQQLEEAIGKEVSAKNFVIIPGNGCSEFISRAEYFFKSGEYKPEEVFFIFTKQETTKRLKIKLGDQLNKTNVFIDKKNRFYQDFLFSPYPTVIELDEGFKVTYASPNNYYIWQALKTKMYF